MLELHEKHCISIREHIYIKQSLNLRSSLFLYVVPNLVFAKPYSAPLCLLWVPLGPLLLSQRPLG